MDGGIGMEILYCRVVSCFFSCPSLVMIKSRMFPPNPITPSLNFTTATATALYSNPTQQSTILHDRQHGSSRLRLRPGARRRCRGGLQARLPGARHRAGATSGWSSAAEHGIVTRRSKQCTCPAMQTATNCDDVKTEEHQLANHWTPNLLSRPIAYSITPFIHSIHCCYCVINRHQTCALSNVFPITPCAMCVLCSIIVFDKLY